MWKRYNVRLEFRTPLASSTPANPQDIIAMLTHRKASEAQLKKKVEAGEEVVPIDKLAEQVGESVQASEEAPIGHAVFPKDDKGIYYEARCVRAHIKDCANVIKELLGIVALKAKVANRVYVEPEKLYLGKEKSDGDELRMIHAWTPQGLISSLKTIDYVKDAVLEFTLVVLDDGVITRETLDKIFEYGGEHGMGQERSQGWGKYKVARFEEVK